MGTRIEQAWGPGAVAPGDQPVTPKEPEAPETPEQARIKQAWGLATPSSAARIEQAWGPGAKAPVSPPAGGTQAAPDGGAAGADYAGALGRGVRSALLPWSQTKAEMEADPTIGATLTKAASNLITGMGTTAAGAAALGGAAALAGVTVPAVALGTVAAGLYGLYSGLGNEASRSAAEGKEPSLVRGLAAAALEINPLVKSAGRASRLLRVAAQVAGSAGLEYSHSESPQAAGVAAVINTILSPVMYMGMRPATPASAARASQAVATDKLLKRVLDRSEAEMADASKLDWLDYDLSTMAGMRQDKLRLKDAAQTGRLMEQAKAQFGAAWDGPDAQLTPPPVAHGARADYELDPRDLAFARTWAAKEVPLEFAAHLINYQGPLTGAAKGQVKAKIKDLWFKLSAQQRREAYQVWRQGKIMAEEVGNDLANMDLGKQTYKDVSVARQWLAPALYVGRKVSEITGLPLEDAVVDVARATDRYTLMAAGYFKDLAEIEKLARKHNVTGAQLWRAVTDKTDQAAKTIHPDVLNRTRELTHDLREQLTKFGYDLGDEGIYYMPTVAKTGSDAAQAVRQRLAEVQHLFGSNSDWFEIAKSDAEGANLVRELIEYAQRTLGKDVQQHQLFTLPEAILDRVKTQPGWLPGAVMTKHGELPAFIKEIDAFKLLQRYIHGNFKGAILDPALKRVQSYQQAMETAGMQKAAAWIERYAQTVSGPGHVSGRWMQTMERMRDAGAKMLASDPNSMGGKALQAFPEALARLSSMAYPAYMVSPRAWARNLLQSYATTAPELGGVYGYGLVTKGLRKAYQTHGLSIAKMKEYLQKTGQIGDLTSERGVERQAFSAVGRAADWANEKAMAPFQWTDLTNRSIAMHTGQAWAEDLANGVPGALKALNGASRGLKNKLSLTKTLEEQAQVLGDYLVSKTQFRYGKAAASALTRELGPVFGQFAMWPQMAAWDLVDAAQHPDRARKLLSRLTPLALLYAAKEAMEPGSDTEASESTMMQYFVGNPMDLSPYPGAVDTSVVFGGGPLVKGLWAAPGAAASVLRSDTPGKAAGQAGRNLAREVLTGYLPPLSAILNEIDRWAKASDRAKGVKQTDTPTRKFVNEVLGGPEN